LPFRNCPPITVFLHSFLKFKSIISSTIHNSLGETPRLLGYVGYFAKCLPKCYLASTNCDNHSITVEEKKKNAFIDVLP